MSRRVTGLGLEHPTVQTPARTRHHPCPKAARCESPVACARQTTAVIPEGGDDAESIALAIRLQQEDDDDALRDVLGVPSDEEADSPSGYSYETLLRLGDAVGTVSRGASVESIGVLRTMSVEDARADTSVKLDEVCSICRMEFEDGESVRVLPCGHADHAECLDTWLGMNKVCPICQHEVPNDSARAESAESMRDAEESARVSMRAEAAHAAPGREPAEACRH